MQLNPYQSPSHDSVAVIAPPKPVINKPGSFSGSLTPELFLAFRSAFNPPKEKWTWKTGLVGIVFAVLMVGSIFNLIAEIELDRFGPKFWLYCGIIGVIITIVTNWFQAEDKEKELLGNLAANDLGIFEPVYGWLTESGMRYVADEFPIDYEWQDFVGYREANGVLAVYTQFPKRLHYVSASWFRSPESWESFKHMLTSQVPEIPFGAKDSTRVANQKMRSINQARDFMDARMWKQAIHEFNQVLKRDEKNPVALGGMAGCLAQSQRFDEALQFANLCIAEGARHPETILMRAQLLFENQQFQHALPDLEFLMKRYPDNPDFLRSRGKALLDASRLDEAMADTDLAIEKNPKDTMAYFNRASIHLETGETRPAIRDLKQALKIDPKYKEAKELLKEARRRHRR